MTTPMNAYALRLRILWLLTPEKWVFLAAAIFLVSSWRLVVLVLSDDSSGFIDDLWLAVSGSATLASALLAALGYGTRWLWRRRTSGQGSIPTNRIANAIQQIPHNIGENQQWTGHNNGADIVAAWKQPHGNNYTWQGGQPSLFYSSDSGFIEGMWMGTCSNGGNAIAVLIVSVRPRQPLLFPNAAAREDTFAYQLAVRCGVDSRPGQQFSLNDSRRLRWADLRLLLKGKHPDVRIIPGNAQSTGPTAAWPSDQRLLLHVTLFQELGCPDRISLWLARWILPTYLLPLDLVECLSEVPLPKSHE